MRHKVLEFSILGTRCCELCISQKSPTLTNNLLPSTRRTNIGVEDLCIVSGVHDSVSGASLNFVVFPNFWQFTNSLSYPWPSLLNGLPYDALRFWAQRLGTSCI
jgi:hypothetical protein